MMRDASANDVLMQESHAEENTDPGAATTDGEAAVTSPGHLVVTSFSKMAKSHLEQISEKLQNKHQALAV